LLVPELAHLPELAHAQVAKLPLPAVERGLGDLELPADVRHRRPRFDLPQGEGDLLHTEPTRPHRTVPSRLRPGAIGPARNLPLSVSPRWSYYQDPPPRRPRLRPAVSAPHRPGFPLGSRPRRRARRSSNPLR